MKKQISKFSVFQTSKIIALLFMVTSAIIFWPMAIVSLFNGEIQLAFVCLISPFLYFFGLFIFYVVFFWIYNIVAGTFGGIEFTLEDRSE